MTQPPSPSAREAAANLIRAAYDGWGMHWPPERSPDDDVLAGHLVAITSEDELERIALAADRVVSAASRARSQVITKRVQSELRGE